MNIGMLNYKREKAKTKLGRCLRSLYKGDNKYYPLLHCNKTNK